MYVYEYPSICMNIVEGNLGEINFRKEASVCKYIVPKGYGSSPAKDATLVVDDSYKKHSDLYYAAVNLEEDGAISTTSSRAAAMVSMGSDISVAENECELGLSYISGDNLFIRHDIAKSHLISKRIKHMESIR